MLGGFFVNFTQAGVVWNKGPQLRNGLHQTACSKAQVPSLEGGPEVYKKTN